MEIAFFGIELGNVVA